MIYTHSWNMRVPLFQNAKYKDEQRVPITNGFIIEPQTGEAIFSFRSCKFNYIQQKTNETETDRDHRGGGTGEPSSHPLSKHLPQSVHEEGHTHSQSLTLGLSTAYSQTAIQFQYLQIHIVEVIQALNASQEYHVVLKHRERDLSWHWKKNWPTQDY